ncbi:MAG: S-ribosylhomocysteine lyase [Clostridia bacterium]|nr:S-ribosylhomocysteine lyase [Clostridia bacterium]
MKKIASFTVDHRTITEGMYISRIDGDVVTYDLRMRKPNQDDLLTHSQMHSLEHLFATFVRNSPLQDKVIYVGPMGCQTGFYLLMRHDNHAENLELVKEVMLAISQYDGEMPGNSEIECGNYRSLDVSEARKTAKRYYEDIKEKTTEDMRYN